MNKIRTLSCLTWALFCLQPPSLATAAPAGQISESVGNVIVSGSHTPPKAGTKGVGVEEGQIVTTGTNGQAVIKFQDGQTIALKSNSVFKVDIYKYDQAAPDQGGSYFALLKGGLRAITGLIGSKNRENWRLATPTATAGIRGTDFYSVIEGGSTYFRVKSGAIGATNTAGTAAFAAGETGVVASPSALGTAVSGAQVPAGIFTELEAMSLTGALGGPSAGAAGAGPTIGGVPIWAVGVGIAGAAAAAAAGGGGGDDTSSTTNH